VPRARSFKKPAKKIPGKGGLRFHKTVGLGFKTPKEAIEGVLNAVLEIAACSLYSELNDALCVRHR
jgi:hypothetical protein